MSISLKDRLNTLKDRWFLTEPAYFMILCTHKIEITPGINCPIACGGGYVYLNEKYFIDKSDAYLDEVMKIEMIRILLKHPYQRQLPNKLKMYISSNLTIANNTSFTTVKLKTTQDVFGSYEYDKECLEVIYDKLDIDIPEEQNNDKQNNKPQFNSSNKDCNSKITSLTKFDDGCSSEEDAYERCQFWKEDDYKNEEINNIIGKIESSSSWGTIPGNVSDVIKKSLIPKFNYKAVFQQFRSTILSSEYQKTRMKPSRRFGYDAMGAKRKNTTSILVAIDTSGSISDEELELAFGFIKGFFKYAVDKLDVIMFDYDIYPESLTSVDKRTKNLKIKGRGGTSFEPIFKYIQNDNHNYDGVLIVTDGYAEVPSTKYLRNNYKHTKYLWVLNNEYNWKRFKEDKDFLKFGKCTYVDKNMVSKH